MNDEQASEIANAIRYASNGLTDDDGFGVPEAIDDIAKAITPFGVGMGEDATGGKVASLTEAVMGITAGLCKVAEAIGDLAEAVRETKR